MERRALTWFAGAALTAAGALAFAQVFDSAAFVPAIVGAALGPFLVGVGLRRDWLAALLSLLAGALFLLVVVHDWNPAQGWLDIGALTSTLDEGWQAARTEVAPVPVTAGVVSILAAATWGCGLVVEQCLRRGATVGALVAPLALFVVATVLGRDQGAFTATFAFAIAAVAFIFVQHRMIVSGRRAQFLGRSTGASSGFLVSGAVIGTLAVVVGIAIAPLLPGSDAGALVDFEEFGSSDRGGVYEPGISPFLDVGARLQQGSRTELFRVRAEQPAYWRLVALDVYDGTWTLDAPSGSIEDGLEDTVTTPFVQEFSITGDLGERWMPAAFEPRRVLSGDVLVVRDSATLVTEADTVNGLTYTVESELPVTSVSPETAAATDTGLAEEVVAEVELPDNFSSVITSAAIDATSGATNPYERAEALQRFFRDPSFVYDPNVRYNASGSEDGQGVIERFLVERRGFCVQFAAAYAVMARAVGIPSRVAVGYTSGTRIGDEFVVTNEEAHAWPEVWLGTEIGWTNMFDPTPPSPLAGGSALPGETPPVANGDPTTPTTVPTTVPPPTTVAPGESPVETPSVAVPSTSASSSGVPWWVRTVAVVALAVGAAGAWVAAVLLTKARRRRRRRDGAPAEVVTGAWVEALDRLDEAGIEVPRTVTPNELAGSVSATNPDAGSALGELAVLFGAVRYGGGRVGASDAEIAWDRVVEFETAMVSGIGVRSRWRRRLRARRREPVDRRAQGARRDRAGRR